MRMMLTASIPHEPFNSLVRNATAGAIIQEILAQLKPEAAYFLEEHGTRCAVLIIDVADQSRIPFFCRAVLPEIQRQLSLSNRHGRRGSGKSGSRRSRAKVEVEDGLKRGRLTTGLVGRRIQNVTTRSGARTRACGGRG